MDSSAGPARTVPTARPLPSGFGTLVETRMYSSPPFANRVAVIPLPSLSPTASTNVEIVVDLGFAEIQSRGLLAADRLLPVKLWPSQFRSHGPQGLHRLCDARVRLGVRHIRRVSVMSVMMARVS